MLQQDSLKVMQMPEQVQVCPDSRQKDSKQPHLGLASPHPRKSRPDPCLKGPQARGAGVGCCPFFVWALGWTQGRCDDCKVYSEGTYPSSSPAQARHETILQGEKPGSVTSAHFHHANAPSTTRCLWAELGRDVSTGEPVVTGSSTWEVLGTGLGTPPL